MAPSTAPNYRETHPRCCKMRSTRRPEATTGKVRPDLRRNTVPLRRDSRRRRRTGGSLGAAQRDTEDWIAIFFEDSFEAMAGMCAVLRAGVAGMSINPLTK